MLDTLRTQRARLSLCWIQSLETAAQPCRGAQFNAAGRTSEACLERFWRRASSRRSRRSVSRLPAWQYIGTTALRCVCNSQRNTADRQACFSAQCQQSQKDATTHLGGQQLSDLVSCRAAWHTEQLGLPLCNACQRIRAKPKDGKPRSTRFNEGNCCTICSQSRCSPEWLQPRRRKHPSSRRGGGCCARAASSPYASRDLQ